MSLHVGRTHDLAQHETVRPPAAAACSENSASTMAAAVYCENNTSTTAAAAACSENSAITFAAAACSIKTLQVQQPLLLVLKLCKYNRQLHTAGAEDPRGLLLFQDEITSIVADIFCKVLQLVHGRIFQDP